MPSARDVVRLLRQAAVLLRSSAVRRGNLVALPAGADVLVSGDLHGSIVNLKAILHRAELGSHPNRHLVLQEFVHGGGQYPNGADMSHRLLDALAALVVEYPGRIHALMGNHEHAQWVGRRVAKEGRTLNDAFDAGVETAYRDHAGEILGLYDELFASMTLAARLPNRVFVCHSVPAAARREIDLAILDRMGLDPDLLARGTAGYAIMWDRDLDPDGTERFADRVEADLLVNGHIAQSAGFARPSRRRIILDCVARPACCLLLPTDEPIDLETLEDRLIYL